MECIRLKFHFFMLKCVYIISRRERQYIWRYTPRKEQAASVARYMTFSSLGAKWLSHRRFQTSEMARIYRSNVPLRPNAITKTIAINYVFPAALLEYDVQCVSDVTHSSRIARINRIGKKITTDIWFRRRVEESKRCSIQYWCRACSRDASRANLSTEVSLFVRNEAAYIRLWTEISTPSPVLSCSLCIRAKTETG